MGLREYHKKRDFSLTPEPRGAEGAASGRSYCIQKHAASHLHYDFRLELEGVLKSWAVPKGPSYDTHDKRLAMRTEDHPVDYGSFEGIIPAGQYGGGTVLLWDRGTWEPLGNPHEELRAGNLKFRLHGEKLKGRWALVKIKGRDGREDEKSWLLIKEKDEEVRAASEWSVTEERPESVATGRSLEQIAEQKDRVWNSNRGDTSKGGEVTSAAQAERARAASGAPAAALSPIEGARRGALPAAVEPQLATLASEAPEGPGWVHEMKFDGYRILARLQSGRTQLLSRNGKDWTAQFPEVAEAVAALPAKQALLDGEVALLLPSGLTSFQALQNRGQEPGQLAYLAFDLLHLDGQDLTRAPLLARKAALQRLLSAAARGGALRFSEHVAGSGRDFFRQACRLGLEGIVSKRADAPYQRGRTRSWLKVKCLKHQEVVIGGYTEPSGSRVGIGALLVGVHGADGSLTYAGKVGTGFTDKVLRDLHARLSKRALKASPFAGKVPGTARAHWVDPRLVAEVEFTEWTADGKLRHPTYRGLREDKEPRYVTREVPSAAEPEERPKEKEKEKTPGKARAKAVAKPSSKASPAPRADEVAGVRLTNADRVVYPDEGLTKRDVALFYEAIADHILPHLEGRPTSLVRCPEGLSKPCFYQKHTGIWAPASLRRVHIQEKTKKGEYLVVESLAGLVGLAQIGILEIHTWNARADSLEKPDRLVIDLDPDPSVPWAGVVASARRVRALLQSVDLDSFVKTTGGKGLHVVVPLSQGLSWEESAAFTGAIAARLVAEDPAGYTDVMSKARRKGKIYVDYLRNTRGATSVSVYSTRAKPHAPVSTPVTWEELKPSLRPDDFTVKTLMQRLGRQKRDPWAGYFDTRQRVTAAMRKAMGVR